MILAAGKGTRMGNLSDKRPKPLTHVAGRCLLDRILAHLSAAHVDNIVVNVHHLASQMETYLTPLIERGTVTISDERNGLLETGGGVKKALPLLGTDPFFVINGDALWTDVGQSNLARLKGAWNPTDMDVLLLLVKRDEALGYEGAGDFFAQEGTGATPLQFRGDAENAPYVFGGVQIVCPDLYQDMPEGAWSNREIFRKAVAQGRLYGLEIDGSWMHVGTAEAIMAAEKKLVQLGVK